MDAQPDAQEAALSVCAADRGAAALDEKAAQALRELLAQYRRSQLVFSYRAIPTLAARIQLSRDADARSFAMSCLGSFLRSGAS